MISGGWSLSVYCPCLNSEGVSPWSADFFDEDLRVFFVVYNMLLWMCRAYWSYEHDRGTLGTLYKVLPTGICKQDNLRLQMI
jgi:hypothetical protein